MILNYATRKWNNSRRGFTLAEFAIVIGIIAIIMGAIWAFGGQAWENARQRQLKDEIYTVVKNTRNFYQSQSGIATGAGSFTVLTPALINANVFPKDITRNSATCTNASNWCADNPWGGDGTTIAAGSLGVCGWVIGLTSCAVAGGPFQYFALELQAIPQKSCINAVMANAGSNAPAGLYDVYVNNATSMLATGSLPPPASNVATACSSPLDNKIDFIYRLTIPQL